jgi:hypothetical protein
MTTPMTPIVISNRSSGFRMTAARRYFSVQAGLGRPVADRAERQGLGDSPRRCGCPPCVTYRPTRLDLDEPQDHVHVSARVVQRACRPQSAQHRPRARPSCRAGANCGGFPVAKKGALAPTLDALDSCRGGPAAGRCSSHCRMGDLAAPLRTGARLRKPRPGRSRLMGGER